MTKMSCIVILCQVIYFIGLRISHSFIQIQWNLDSADGLLTGLWAGWCGILIPAGRMVFLFSVLFSLALWPTQLEVPSWAQSSLCHDVDHFFLSSAEVRKR